MTLACSPLAHPEGFIRPRATCLSWRCQVVVSLRSHALFSGPGERWKRGGNHQQPVARAAELAQVNGLETESQGQSRRPPDSRRSVDPATRRRWTGFTAVPGLLQAEATQRGNRPSEIDREAQACAGSLNPADQSETDRQTLLAVNVSLPSTRLLIGWCVCGFADFDLVRVDHGDRHCWPGWLSCRRCWEAFLTPSQRHPQRLEEAEHASGRPIALDRRQRLANARPKAGASGLCVARADAFGWERTAHG